MHLFSKWANIFTKALPTNKFTRLRIMLGMKKFLIWREAKRTKIKVVNVWGEEMSNKHLSYCLPFPPSKQLSPNCLFANQFWLVNNDGPHGPLLMHMLTTDLALKANIYGAPRIDLMISWPSTSSAFLCPCHLFLFFFSYFSTSCTYCISHAAIAS